MASSSSSPPASPKYDVFLSFDGEDTRKGFTDHLYHKLKDYRFNIFIDDKELERGEIIPNEVDLDRGDFIPNGVEQAIEKSRACIIVFSRGYLESRSCLEELVKIMDCKRTLGLLVFPICYGIEPSDVRLDVGAFAAEFQKLDLRIRLRRWEEALVEAAALSAYVLNKDGYEGEFIGKVIEDISRELTIANLDVAIHQVGIDFPMRKISNYLDVGGSEDVRMIGIWGMGGIGKTELAKALFIKYYDHFGGKSFLRNVREKKLIDLQEQLLFDILKPVNIEVSNVDEGTKEIKKRLGHLTVLIILDDIDHVDQLDALAIKRDSFGVGSRVIITARDEHLLKILRVDKIYSVQTLNKKESLELLSWYAFKNHRPGEEYLELSRKVVDVCGGLPLALQIVGCSVFTKSKSEWTSALDELKRHHPVEIHKKLKISYDGLTDDDVKAIFLDISCFFSGKDKDVVMAVLDGCDLYPEIGILELHERCLVSVDKKGNLKMHKLIKDMGRQIAYSESPDSPGERSRLCHPEDVKHVLMTKSGTEVIEGLALDLQEPDEPSFSTEAFTNMQGLRLLKLKGVKLSGSFKHISKELRWLSWHGCPLKVIPEDFDQPNLVALELHSSKLIQVWEDSNVLLEKLKIVNLSDSRDLIILPDFSRLPNLEKLILKGCTSLSEVHPSIGDLERLAFVNLTGCTDLKNFPPDFYNSKCIETLLLNGCSSFENLAEGLGDMVSLTTLQADNTAIKQIPSSIVKLKNLRYLALCSVEGSQIRNLLPSSLHVFSYLRRLCLWKCNLTDEDIPEDLGSLYSLEKLELERNCFSILPSLSCLSKLKWLDITACINLHTIRDLPRSLEFLGARGCTKLKAMPDFSEMSNMIEFSAIDLPKLTDIPGLDKSLNSKTRIHKEWCTNLNANSRKEDANFRKESSKRHLKTSVPYFGLWSKSLEGMAKSKKFINRMKTLFGRSREGLLIDLNEEDLEQIALQEQKIFPFESLVAATKNFHSSHKLGEGGFGPVYKGKLEDGREIAVKKLSHSNQGKKEFMNEAELLARVQHPNVVNLLGYCAHGVEKLLVYEYFANESLDKLLFKTNRRAELDWKRRYDIICGITKGLLYLHEGSHNWIIHRDIKASNILLDEKWVPKIADFGMARLFPEDQTHINTRVASTKGYMAPEYVMHGHLSEKADVFSFGVLVLELISGQRNSSFSLNVDAQNLLDWAYKLYKKGRSLEIMDSILASSAVPEQVAMCIQMGLLCVQGDPKSRPTMHRVVVILSKKPSNLEEPNRPGVSATGGTSDTSGDTNSDTSGDTNFHPSRSSLYMWSRPRRSWETSS